jgi:hypothetical protein
MFARRAVSTVARRAIAARPIVPARSFANSMRRCECAIFLPASTEGWDAAIGAGKAVEWRGEKIWRIFGGF